MRSRAAILVAGLLWGTALAPSSAAAQDWQCDPNIDLSTQLGLSACAAQTHAYWDGLLNDIYQQVIAGSDPAREDRLRQAQRAWLPYRDLTCQMEAADYAGGSIAPMIASLCLARLTERRTRDLETYLPN